MSLTGFGWKSGQKATLPFHESMMHVDSHDDTDDDFFQMGEYTGGGKNGQQVIRPPRSADRPNPVSSAKKGSVTQSSFHTTQSNSNTISTSNTFNKTRKDGSAHFLDGGSKTFAINTSKDLGDVGGANFGGSGGPARRGSKGRKNSCGALGISFGTILRKIGISNGDCPR
jgi:hypothetical protein